MLSFVLQLLVMYACLFGAGKAAHVGFKQLPAGVESTYI